MEKKEVYVLSVQHGLDSLTWASWIYLAAGLDVFFVDPARGNEETWALHRLAERMPVVFRDLTGDASFRQLGEEEKLFSGKQPDAQMLPEQLNSCFGMPKGLVTAPAASPSMCVYGAVLAVRLGYGFLPDHRLAGYPALATGQDSSFPVVVLDAREKYAQEKWVKNRPVHFINHEKECYRYLEESGQETNYLLILNSADLGPVPQDALSLSEMWVKGLSLLGTVLASYRRVGVFDVAQGHPEGRETEKRVQQFVQESGFKPEFQAILGGPGGIPFILQENKEIGASGEEGIRDLHLQLNHDLFYDVAEGRLFQSTPGGLSLQLLSTKYYSEMQRNQERQVLIAAVPHVETGIIFDSDRALIEGKLKPLLESAGHQVTLLTGKEAGNRQVASALAGADFFLYSGHGGPETLNTHQRFLTRGDLSDLPPLVAYASACSTISPRPNWLSVTEGQDWEAIQVPPRQVIGLSLVERGAVSYVGGATVEDFQFTNAVYSIFMESILLKGMSVGQALNETRNFAVLYTGILSQKAPEAYRLSKEGLANIIHQQILLGDPALVPYPEVQHHAKIQKNLSGQDQEYRLSLDIPPESWRRVRVPVQEKEPTRSYYRTRTMENMVPVDQDIISWGDFYPLAYDSQGVAERALMSGFLHLTLDLTPGEAPLHLELHRAEGREECLFCTGERVGPVDATAYWHNFVIPFLMLPPVSFDMKKGWPFVPEDRGDFLRVHWLVPVLVIDEIQRRAYQGEKMEFRLKTGPGKPLTGTVVHDSGEAGSFLLVQAVGQERGEQGRNTFAQAVCDRKGAFKLFCGPEDVFVTAEEQFPLYDLLGPFHPVKREFFPADFARAMDMQLARSRTGILRGRVLDTLTGEPIEDALVRVWRGKLDPCGYYVREGWVGEEIADTEGKFSFSLAEGEYLLSATACTESRRYKSKEISFTVCAGEERHEIYTLDRAASIKGKITFAGSFPPDLTMVLKRYPLKGKGETLSSAPVRRDGTYECLIGFQDRFCILIEKEGWQGIKDTNGDQGYRLAPEEILYRHYFFRTNDES
ncbi:C25 family cysteine peptidase [Candidatus Formimonas warabiya]|uniref:C25 family cysteine peptidase n=1 Tax=Formimonas warabiya TaxID=1761012 RepID=UPI001BE4DEA3|nr:C25 family cysteine peptidase [Candidatus Formimonas warabiya]